MGRKREPFYITLTAPIAGPQRKIEMRGSFSINAGAVDIPNLQDAGGWRKLLAGAGVRSACISGSDVFHDYDTYKLLQQLFDDRDTPVFQVIIPDLGTVEGPFQIRSIDYSGVHQCDAVYNISAVSVGALTFVPLPEPPTTK